MPKVNIDDKIVHYYLRPNLENLILRLRFAIFMKDSDLSAQLTKSFFSEFFIINPTFAIHIKGIEE